MNSIYSMGDSFNVENIKKELKISLKNKGYDKNKIAEVISMCDYAYNKFKIPYPIFNETQRR